MRELPAGQIWVIKRGHFLVVKKQEWGHPLKVKSSLGLIQSTH